MVGLDRARTSGNVTIRAFDPSDRPALLSGRDEEARRFLGDGSPEPAPVACIWVDGTIVGWIDYDQDRSWLDHAEVNVGYSIFPEHRGRGYGTAALRLLCAFLDAQDPPLRPTLLIDPDNGPSLALAARAGFEQACDRGGQRLFRQPAVSGAGLCDDWSRPAEQPDPDRPAGNKSTGRAGRVVISQFFEVQVRDGQADRYLEFAARLKPDLEAMGGCLFLDRFASLTRENLLLSYQIWQDEGSMIAWRVDPKHHSVQEAGREEVFADYRIRIAQVVHEERPNGSPWTPERFTPYNDPTRRPPTFVVASESTSRDTPVDANERSDVFESVYRPGVFAHLFDVGSSAQGVDLGRRLLADPTTEYFRVFEVMRDYGMFERTEAPQYYPPVTRPTGTEPS